MRNEVLTSAPVRDANMLIIEIRILNCSMKVMQNKLTEVTDKSCIFDEGSPTSSIENVAF
jgi:hypothetical protein